MLTDKKKKKKSHPLDQEQVRHWQLTLLGGGSVGVGGGVVVATGIKFKN